MNGMSPGEPPAAGRGSPHIRVQEVQVEDGVSRRLAAILAADVAGYSRLMNEDEDATVTSWRASRRDVVDPAIATHRGRIVKHTGDGFLAEFATIVDAVRCAVDIQAKMAERNVEIADERRMQFRIGINLGDIYVDDEDIHGDGVNIAARLEGLAKPGGIAVSGAVYEQVHRKLALDFEELGPQRVKNIAEPIPVFRTRLTSPAAHFGALAPKPRRGLYLTAGAASIAVLFAVGAALWFYLGLRWTEAMLPQPAAHVSLAKPSIAVLPFDNMSGDPAQEYFSDGITESIITEISRFPELLVIARNSTFAYKSRAIDIRQAGRELDARYVLEGSVQKSDERVRVTVQLIDSDSGHHVWAERYDRILDDLFGVQDDITWNIVSALAIKVGRTEQARALAKPAGRLDAYDLVLRGRERLAQGTLAANMEAREMFEQAIEIAPRFASAHVGLGQAHLESALNGWTEWVEKAFTQAQALGQEAIGIEERNADAYRLLGRIHLHRGEHETAITTLERAITINPNDADSYASYGAVLLWAGKPDNAIHALETALRLDPKMDAKSLMPLGLAYYLKHRYTDVVAVLHSGLTRNPQFLPTHAVLAAAYGQMGLQEQAERSAKQIYRLDPFFTIDAFTALLADPAHRSHVAAGLRKATAR